MIAVAKAPGATGQWPWWCERDGRLIVGAAPTPAEARKQAGGDHAWMLSGERSPVNTRIGESKL